MSTIEYFNRRPFPARVFNVPVSNLPLSFNLAKLLRRPALGIGLSSDVSTKYKRRKKKIEEGLSIRKFTGKKSSMKLHVLSLMEHQEKPEKFTPTRKLKCLGNRLTCMSDGFRRPNSGQI